MRGNLAALGRYTIVKVLMLGIAVIVALYLTILIVNMGGKLDDVRRSEIKYEVTLRVNANPETQLMPPSEVNKMIDRLCELEYRRLGLDRPFFVRSFSYLVTALSLSLGRSENLVSDSGSRTVKRIILERLPATLLLFGTANLLIFFTAVTLALAISRKYGSWIDRLVVSLAPTSAAPGWFYGIFLILIFAAVLRVLPWGGMVDAPPPETTVGYAGSLVRHMILPVLAMACGGLLASTYSWRTFFLIYSSEDYVDLAKAKGLSSRAIERRYILRPTLPTIITNFMLMIIAMWMGAIILETVFNWPGLGRLYLQAVNLNDTPVIVGVMVIYGYLLAISVFLLDFIYAIVDPRVRIGAGAKKGV
ncbi:MAG TPA: ABC transporter permease [Candidatus Acetothermia bacterium]|nr:ABC transporter permease [Candidatus Acetothermia bacterium]